MTDSIERIAGDLDLLSSRLASDRFYAGSPSGDMREIATRLRALSPAGGDWVMVPRKVTRAMLEAYWLHGYDGSEEEELKAMLTEGDLAVLQAEWNAMLAASPQQEPGAEVSSRGESCWHAEVGEGGDKVTCPDCKQTPAAAVDDCSIDATDNADYVEHCAAKLAKLGYLITGMTLSACAADYRARITSSGQTLAGAGGVDLDLGQFREAVNCWRAVITTAAVNLPFNLAAYRASCGVSVPDRLLALIDSQAATSAGTTGDGEAAMAAIYDDFCAKDNGDVPLERYPQGAVDALANAGWAVVPCDLPFAVLGDAAQAGVFETGNPKHGWDYLVARTRIGPYAARRARGEGS